jgi:hypothetical protein
MNGFFVALFVRKQLPTLFENKTRDQKRSWDSRESEEAYQVKRRRTLTVRWKPTHKVMTFA